MSPIHLLNSLNVRHSRRLLSYCPIGRGRGGGFASPRLSRSFSSIDSTETKEPVKTAGEHSKIGFVDKLFGVQSNYASKGFNNRWLMVIPAFATQMCVGSPWAWSLVADVATREIGFVAQAASDWTLMQTALPLSIVFGMMAVSSSIVGKWQLKVGPRKSIAVGSAVFGGGFMLGALALHLHSLPILYGGFGVMAGTAIGLAYTPPIQTLLEWFPDKKGLASGITVAGFGCAALVFAPVYQRLMNHFAKLPEYLGPTSDFITKTIDGKLFATVNNQLVEVVSAGSNDLAKLAYSLQEGLYVVGSGSTGAAEALAVMGAAYFTVMLGSALTLRRPHPEWKLSTAPERSTVTNKEQEVVPVQYQDVSVDETMKTSQFHLLGVTFFCLATGGMGIFSVAKPMMSEVFSSVLPSVVTAAFASKYLLALSAGNMGGRLGWAAVSDAIGRKKTFYIYTLASIPLYCALPTLVGEVVSSGSAIPLFLFCGSTIGAISMMGGTYAILPAYEADIFGTKYLAAIHGRMLLYSGAAALAGPYMLLQLRAISERSAIDNLLTLVPPEKFLTTFGVPVENAAELFAAKTLSISKLLVLCPPGTVDPTPHLYDTTMYTLSGLMAIAAISHGLVKPLQRSQLPAATVVSDGLPSTPQVDDSSPNKAQKL